MKTLNLSHFLMTLLACLVGKSLYYGQMSIGEALVGAVIVGYCAFLQYLEHFKTKQIEKQFEDRLKSLENKISMQQAGNRIMNQRG